MLKYFIIKMKEKRMTMKAVNMRYCIRLQKKEWFLALMWQLWNWRNINRFQTYLGDGTSSTGWRNEVVINCVMWYPVIKDAFIWILAAFLVATWILYLSTKGKNGKTMKSSALSSFQVSAYLILASTWLKVAG